MGEYPVAFEARVLPLGGDRRTSGPCRYCPWTGMRRRHTASKERKGFAQFLWILCVQYHSATGSFPRPSHPVVGCGNHQSVWHQDGRFGLLDVSDGHHRDGNLGRARDGKNRFMRWHIGIRLVSKLQKKRSLCFAGRLIEIKWEDFLSYARQTETLRKEAELTRARVTVPLCLCQTLWSGSRSSGQRQTFGPGRGCLSAGHRCNLRKKRQFGQPWKWRTVYLSIRRSVCLSVCSF